jgi:hypothetical protein
MITRTVRGVRDLGVNKGATGSHMIECDDGKTYIVKFAGRSKAAVNEFLGQTLASDVGLPVPVASLVEVGADLVAGSADMRYRAIAPGPHQGSEMVRRAFDLGEWERRPSYERQSLTNLGSLPGTICHDNWILTTDRDRADNHLSAPVEGGLSYLMVDFTHAFTGPTWTVDTLEQGSYFRTLVPTHPFIADQVRGMASFEPTLERIETLSDKEIEDVVAATPDSWGVTEEEKLCLVGFLELRRGLLRSILTSNSTAFPNWSG